MLTYMRICGDKMKDKYTALLLAGTIELSSFSFTGCMRNNNETDEIIEELAMIFGVGEHIISVPIIEDNKNRNFQYDYRDGYEIVGVSSSSYGKYDLYGGEALLYKNITPVKCVRNENGYTSFGAPIEKEKTKTFK